MGDDMSVLEGTHSFQLSCQSVDGIKCSLALSTSSILDDLAQKMLNSLSRIRLNNTLSNLNPSNLKALKELRSFDSQVSSYTSDSCFGGEICRKTIFEELQVWSCKRRCSSEFVESELEWCLRGCGEVNWGVGDSSGRDIWDAGEGFDTRVACYRVLDWGDGVLDFGWESGVPNDEAGFRLTASQRDRAYLWSLASASPVVYYQMLTSSSESCGECDGKILRQHDYAF